MSKLPKIRICAGKSCRKRGDALDRLRVHLSDQVRVDMVGCQKICDGPVVGIKINGSLEWFDSMDSQKALNALERWIETGSVGPPLLKRRVAKRSGRLRK